MDQWENKLFLTVIILLAYSWVGYPALLCIVRWVRGVRRSIEKCEPSLSLIIAVHNEESQIAAKLDDCLRFLYPADQMEIIIVSDGSTDGTEDIVKEYAERDARVQLLRAERVGKSCAQNLAVQHARGQILVLTDAGTRTRPDLLQKLMSNFADPKVGLVTGVVYFGHPDKAVLKGQGLYWRYEFFLRQAESDTGILATATGTALAMRRELFQPMEHCYGDDCILPLDVRLRRYRVLQDPEARVYDTMPHTMEGELQSRIRMTARNWTGTLSRPALLNPFRFPLTGLGLISHKLLRWLTPFLLAILFTINTALVLQGRETALWLVQILFYFSALVGWWRARKAQSAGIFGYPFSFCLANAGFFLGMVKVFRNQKLVTF